MRTRPKSSPRRIVSVAAAVAAALLIATAQANAKVCTPKGKFKIVEQSKNAVAFSTPTDKFAVKKYYGCLLARDKKVLIGSVNTFVNSDLKVIRVRLAGRFAAFAAKWESLGSIRVVDLKSGKRVGAYGPGGDDEIVSFRQVLLNDEGSVAWLWEERFEGFEVLGGPHKKLKQVLDKGKGIDPGSLRLSGSTVRWKNNGVARSAQIP